LENNGIDLCKNPQIIRRTIPERPPTYEQRVSVRYLQPPPLPPSGSLIIKEVSTEQPPPLSSLPPLILRERPPTPPPILSRDIIIERWIPYGRQTERHTIVQQAAPPIEYPKPSCTIVIYEVPQARIVRKFEQLDVTNENPEDYVASYSESLLNSTTLVQQARNVGVIEDI
ncbi:unnamed protein product, partial [Rotaria sp. Silwood1]